MTNKPQPKEPRLFDRVRTVIRLRGMSYLAENSYVDWIRRFITFHGKRHPVEMGAAVSMASAREKRLFPSRS